MLRMGEKKDRGSGEKKKRERWIYSFGQGLIKSTSYPSEFILDFFNVHSQILSHPL